MFSFCHFNPRSREGSDYDGPIDGIALTIFQSTLPRGERRELGVNQGYPENISIHAPARGATDHQPVLRFLPSHFNPRSREGSDGYIPAFCLYHGEFQSTLPRGERHDTYRAVNSACRFQSTLPRGERPKPMCMLTWMEKFQSTLPRGERRYILPDFWFLLLYFNPRSREGSDFNFI